MGWLLFLLLLLVVAASVVTSRRGLAARRSRELESSNRFRLSRRAADEDVTRFGEELVELHVATLTTDLDDDLRRDYRSALDSYEAAKQQLRDGARAEDVSAVTRALADGRFALACVLARQDGEALPERRPPCFFNPAHGPARTDVTWAPSGGVEREVPVCFRCSERLAAGLGPDVRRVRWGSGRVPWFQAGPAYGAYVEGYYGAAARVGHFPGFVVGSMLLDGAGAAAASPVDWSGWGGAGAWSDDGAGGVHGGGWDGGHAGHGGHDGGHHGGFDGGHHGGFDGGGGDGGGGF